ncbi:MAG: arsenical pump-driving ATPase [Kofleriaceae bacterium]|nr:arsenical pump-driving ATPase [Kofleriaceae bacterium]MCL4223675.1 arsenical pump-driving ATPase [Myxococcales bacterium]
MRFLDAPIRFLFFTGKGGVGKTALSCATALRLAEQGRKVLLVSTDPASNLGQMLGATLGNHPTPVPGAPGLHALDIDPEVAADDYRERVIGSYRDAWTAAQVAELEEQLAGSCTMEIAAFDEFAGLLAGDGEAWDHVIFDTAPTGHTLRLLSLPRAWTGFLETTAQGASCLGPHAGLKLQQDRFATALATLTDGAHTTVVLVTRPDRAALREAARTSDELVALGLANQQLVINAVFEASDRHDPVALALEQRGREALDAMPAPLRALPSARVPLRPFNMVGLPALRGLLTGEAPAALAPATGVASAADLPPLATLVDELAAPGHGLILVMGKGGVGKTTIAAAIAVELAARGHAVHLSTTDPAAHVAATVTDQLAGLTVSRIDPEAETRAYVEHAMATRGARLDDAGRALLAEDLRSPCWEEVAVFGAFSRLISQARTRFVVLDTAPTGHTLLLLDTTGAYHTQIVRGWKGGRVETPLMRLRDPAYTRVLLVTLAETTPVSEAAQLQADLRRADIEPHAWVVNASLAAAGSTDPLLRQRIAGELAQIELVRAQHARRVVVVPWQLDEPVGFERLRRLAGAAPSREAG